jgi:sec-independent protein translocase protein TatC
MSKKGKDRAEMSFLGHLEELRWHLVRSVAAIFVLAITAFVFSDFIFNSIILAPKHHDFFTNRLFCLFSKNLLDSTVLCINSQPFEIINIKMAGQFSTHIRVSLFAGLIVAFPYVFWEIWSFIKPALYDHERSTANGAVFFTSLLFVLGVLFGYYLIVPLSVHFLGSYNVSAEVTNQINLGSYIGTVTSITLAAGVIFELPIIVYFLSKAGLVTPQFLRKYRRHSLVAILALSAIITPPDIFSQILVAFPLLILYEIGIGISSKIQKNDKYAYIPDEEEVLEEEDELEGYQ